MVLSCSVLVSRLSSQCLGQTVWRSWKLGNLGIRFVNCNALALISCSNHTKMAEKLEDLNLPMTVVTRIVKEALPEGVSISKEARTGLAKAASVFVLYVTSAATNIVKNNKRKALTGQDVVEAMKDIEFDRFVDPLNEALETYRQAMVAKKNSNKKKDDAEEEETDEPVILE